MIPSWIILFVAVAYLSILFAVASYGDKARSTPGKSSLSRPNTYAFSMAVYCTTWTFFGSVGLAATSGYNFLAIYIGPILAITLGFALFKRVINLAKEERLTSVADFIGSRYGKNLKVAGVAALIAVIGTIPYIALQLKAISGSVSTLILDQGNNFTTGMPVFGDISVLITLTLAIFAILFGTRHADATEHQHGLMLAIAMESVIKLVAFLCVGAFVMFFIFDGFQDLFHQASQDQNVREVFSGDVDWGSILILTFLSLIVFMLLPRQFHVSVVENNTTHELERARWLFPLYLVAINLFVIPIAIAGLIKFGPSANADDFVLLLPLLEGNGIVSLFAFIGGLSAGTAMVVVASVALAIMISNDLVLPSFLRSRATSGFAVPEDMEDRILNIRRTAILVVLFLAFVYYKAADNTAALASIGLVSFAAIAQLAPAFFGGLFWRRATARGAMAGMITGFAVWAYTLLLPTLLPTDSSFVANGLFGWTMLRPQALFETQLDPLTNGVIWSLIFNSFAFVVGSLSRTADPQERLQASLFVPYSAPVVRLPGIGKSEIEIAELKNTLARYIGARRTERSFELYWRDKEYVPDDQATVDDELMRYSEQLLASAIGASSSRLVHTLLIKRFDRSSKSNIKLLDEASKALQYNQDVLQTAFDQLEQGISVFDGDFRLASWNRQFRSMLNLPPEIGQAGVPLSEVAREIAASNNFSKLDPNGEQLAYRLVNQVDSWQMTLPEKDLVLEIGTSPMPEGGIVVTWNNITERVRAARALRDANETLEGRVEERTRELEAATRRADQANQSKTRFLAAAGHDVLQPLNAARLYSETLVEKAYNTDNAQIAENISRSLGSVEEILSSILAISRLDTAEPEINLVRFPLRQVTEQLQLEFAPAARAAGLELVFVHSSVWIKSDQALLRRLLQNLISNAIKFTPSGKVLVGSRRLGDVISVEIIDTGVGMDEDQQKKAFAEFTRLHTMSLQVPGLGLGLSIVERIADLLGLQVSLRSSPGNGAHFKVAVERSEPKTASTEKSAAKQLRRSGQLTGMKVLCIDNDLNILDGMSALLNQWGCQVGAFPGLQEAIDYLDSNELPDIILADYHLEQTTGVEVYKEITSRFGSDIPGVLITADRTEAVKQEAGSAGMNILNKPVKRASLRAFLSQGHQRRIAAE